MGRLLLLLWCLILCPALLSAEAFVINQYDVKIYLNANGSFNVTETIDLRFTEARRGIIRDIPVRFREDSGGPGERAIRPMGQETYEIIIDKIQVKGHPYQHYREGDFLRIRIGDPDKRLRGNQQYVISYTVWGALNEFTDHVEFSWNIIGHQWDTRIEKVSFSIQGEAGVSFSANDVVWATGRAGGRQQNASINVNGNQITGFSTQPLNRFEGISIATRHPKSHFSTIHPPLELYAENFLVENHRYIGKWVRPGYMNIEEHFKVKFKKPVKTFSRVVGSATISELQAITVFPLPKNIELITTGDNIGLKIRRIGQETVFEFFKKDNSAFDGTLDFKLVYHLWGIATEAGTGDQMHIQAYGFKPSEPVANLELQFEAPFQGPPQWRSGNVRLPQLRSNSDNGQWGTALSYPQYRIHQLQLDAGLQSGALIHDQQPAGIFGKHYLVDEMGIEVKIDQRQGVEIDYSWTVVHPLPSPNATFEPIFLRRFSHRPNGINGRIGIPNYNLLDNRIVPAFEIDSPFEIISASWGSRRILRPDSEVKDKDSYSTSAKVTYRGLFRKNSGRDQVAIPLLTFDNEQKRNLDLKVTIPEGADPNDLYMDLVISGQKPFSLAHTDGVFSYPGGSLDIPSGESVVLFVDGHRDFAGSPSMTTQLYLLLRNNMPIWWMAAIIFVLYLLWNRFGRNPRKAVVVQFYPPEKITSAEAGLLWDDRLHKKDLISLIYYWAGRGYLEVEEVGSEKKPDYILRKKKELPAQAKPFEKTFFKGLFFKEEVKLSELKSRFSKTMSRSYKELMAYGKQNDFYVPGSRGFGCALTILGIFLLLLGLGGMIVAFFTGHYSYAIAPLVAGMAMILFGRIMPKKGPFGFKKHQKLLGFREFVRTAEIDRIKALYKENPGYFDKTIAYAIVFGLGKQWAEKFDGLMIEPPDWYKGHDSGRPFTTIYFTNALIRSMHRMNYDLSVPPVSSSSGGGVSSWSGGGGSSFGGGFSSGGGFGGGGGSSW